MHEKMHETTLDAFIQQLERIREEYGGDLEVCIPQQSEENDTEVHIPFENIVVTIDKDFNSYVLIF